MPDLKNVTDNKELWKTVKPFLSDKITTFSNTSLVEKGKIVSDESKVANSLNNFMKRYTFTWYQSKRTFSGEL